MSLFVDGPPATLEDLAAFDSSVLTVASTEGIDVTGKLELARTLLAVDLESLLFEEGVDRVVVTTALKAFHIFRTLEYIYRDAYNSQLNDRYEGRWRQYESLRRDAWQRLLETGIGLVDQPLPKASAPEVSSVAGSGSAGSWYVRASWVSSRGEEGEGSDVTEWTGTTTSVLRVRAVQTPHHATGWNVYVGGAPEETTRQNTELLALNATWTQSMPVNAMGPRPTAGQPASYMRAVPRLLWRG